MALTPYYPPGMVLEGYQDLAVEFWVILAVFFSVCAITCVAAWIAARKLQFQERCMAVWMLATALIHIIVEGSFVVYDKFYQNADPNMLLLELWKEYSKADSRYATRDPAVVGIEALTAFVVGPACLVGFAALIAKWSWRWNLIILASMAQLYGDILYFGTNWLEGGTANRPELLYFWFYFIFMNGIWIVLPTWCIAYASSRCIAAVRAVEVGGVKDKRM